MKDDYIFMKLYLTSLWVVLFSSIVMATPPTIPCEQLEHDHSFYENIILVGKNTTQFLCR